MTHTAGGGAAVASSAFVVSRSQFVVPMRAFNAEALPVGMLFSGSRLYYVPDFQRPVSWGTADAETLLSDLWLALADSSDSTPAEYFFGNIVLTDPSARPEYGGTARPDGLPAAAIIDGQQRIVTFTILFAVLRDLIGDSEPWLAGMIEEGGAPRVIANPGEAAFLKTYVQTPGRSLGPIGLGDGGVGVQNIREIRAAVLRDFNSRDTDELSRFARYLRDHCWISVVTAPDVDRGFLIFAKMNTRGQPLKETEILKSIALGRLEPGERATRTARWNKLRREARQAFEHMPSHVHAIHGSAPEKIMRTNVRLMDETGGATRYLDEIFFPLAESLITVVGANMSGAAEAKEINRLLRYLNLQTTQEWIAPVICFITINRDKPKLILEFLELFDRFAHGLLMAGRSRDKRMPRYGAIINAVRRAPGRLPPLETITLTSDERRTAYHNAASNLHQRGRSVICRLTLLRLSGVADNGPFTMENDNITIEHVLPKSPRANSQWKQWYPNADDRQIQTKRLGNLVLLPEDQNHGAKNLEFAEKKAIFFPGGRPTVFALTNELMPLDDWKANRIEERTERLLARLAAIWHIMPPEGQGRQ